MKPDPEWSNSLKELHREHAALRKWALEHGEYNNQVTKSINRLSEIVEYLRGELEKAGIIPDEEGIYRDS